MTAKTAAKGGFTPGEWKVVQGAEPRDFIVADSTGATICEPNFPLYGDKNGFDKNVRHIELPEALANAQLIAASPKLYAALKLADYRLTYLVVTQRGKVRETTFNILEEVRAAIKTVEAIHG